MKKEAKIAKNVTMPAFEKGMDFMAQSFGKVFERFDKQDKKLKGHDTVFDVILKEIRSAQEDRREHKMAIASLYNYDVGKEKEIEGLKTRVLRLEKKVK